MKKITIIFASILFVLIIGNLIFLDIGVFKEKESDGQKVSNYSQQAAVVVSPQVEKASEVSCSQVCQELIDERIKKALLDLPENTETIVEKTTVVEKTSEVSTQTVSYIPISGGFSSSDRDWVSIDASSFYLDTIDYPSLDKAYFVAVIKTEYGQGRVFARLYDATHGIGVQGSEVSNDSEDYEMKESEALSFWKGKNLYKVQVKSLNGYAAFFDSGKVKLYLK